MKQIFVLLCFAFAVISCNNENKESKAAAPATTDGAATTDVKLPFELAGPYRNWQIGSTENVAAAMAGLKAFVDNDFTALAAVTGDSLDLDFDLFQAKLSRDSAMKFFTNARGMYNDLKITMYDYVSVISADKKAEWVTIWYKQSWKDAKGVADSMNVVNDIRLEKGKMVELDEKTSHFMKK
ncbi:MAG: hypothetical protein K2X48_12795 [Chitinophagaceae bacterium]|nr:hypothetical protein [Chitinophagaceae bacterium]